MVFLGSDGCLFVVYYNKCLAMLIYSEASRKKADGRSGAGERKVFVEEWSQRWPLAPNHV